MLFTKLPSFLEIRILKWVLLLIIIPLVSIAFIKNNEQKKNCASECNKLGYSEYVFSGSPRDYTENCLCIDPSGKKENLTFDVK